MTEHSKLPIYDDKGINLADPNDRLGLKTKYISIVQEKALFQHLGKSHGKALDIGCGYGRMAESLSSLGYAVTGVEPSERILKIAAERQPQHEWYVGALPDLPVERNSYDLVCLFNVARALHLMNSAHVCEAIPDFVKPGGKLVIIDNLRQGDHRYLPDPWFEQTFTHHGMRLITKKPIRASRWFVIYLIRYGLIPEIMFDRIASWELIRMSKKKKVPRFSYHNYIYIFKKHEQPST